MPTGTNLHEVIAQGKHEGMPAWSADLSSDQIDSLAGFILSPVGSQLVTNQCGSCHEAPELNASDPIELKNSLEQGQNYTPHQNLDIPLWDEVISQEEQTALLNFLVAPDGQRLFVTNCSACHGRSVSFSGSEEELTQVIGQGGLHLDMPPWKEKLNGHSHIAQEQLENRGGAYDLTPLGVLGPTHGIELGGGEVIRIGVAVNLANLLEQGSRCAADSLHHFRRVDGILFSQLLEDTGGVV